MVELDAPDQMLSDVIRSSQVGIRYHQVERCKKEGAFKSCVIRHVRHAYESQRPPQIEEIGRDVGVCV